MAFDISRREVLTAAGVAGVAFAASATKAASPSALPAASVGDAAAARTDKVVRLYMGIPEVVAAGQDLPYCQGHDHCLVPALPPRAIDWAAP